VAETRTVFFSCLTINIERRFLFMPRYPSFLVTAKGGFYPQVSTFPSLASTLYSETGRPYFLLTLQRTPLPLI